MLSGDIFIWMWLLKSNIFLNQSNTSDIIFLQLLAPITKISSPILEMHVPLNGETSDFRAVSTTEQFDRCSIGVSPEGDPDTSFCGQMGAVYLFADSLSLEQANSLFCLGPAYQSYFVHDSGSTLPEGYKKVYTCFVFTFGFEFSLSYCSICLMVD